ncbi:MAG TPA: glycoside hydrolase family 43 C-terminal domain-containing protein [Methylophilaceae bacterium]|jgi:hypothetical protein
MVTRFNKVSALMGAFLLLMGISASVFAGEYDGVWTLDDSNGKPFTATLSADGTASGTHNTSLKHGTWKEQDGKAVINWTTGWTTIISKDGDHYSKAAFKPGAKLTDKPTNTSSAVKKK